MEEPGVRRPGEESRKGGRSSRGGARSGGGGGQASQARGGGSNRGGHRTEGVEGGGNSGAYRNRPPRGGGEGGHYNQGRRGGGGAPYRQGGGGGGARGGGRRLDDGSYLPEVESGPKAEEKLFDNITSSGINFDKYENIPVSVVGSNAPTAWEHFDTNNIMDRGVLANVTRAGYRKLTPVQKHVVPMVLAGRDVLACAQTGSGKTAAFLLPVIHGLLQGPARPSHNFATAGSEHRPRCLIVTPTRELAIQIYDEARKFAHGTRVACGLAYGGVATGSQLAGLPAGVDLLAATPGRLIDFLDQKKISFLELRYLVLDEVDRMLDMGFMPDVKRIMSHATMPGLKERTSVMVSATIPPAIRTAAEQFLKPNYLLLSVGVVGGACSDVSQRFLLTTRQEKKGRLVAELRRAGSAKTLVFVRTKFRTQKMAQQLAREGFSCTSIHGDRSQGQREQALAQFRDGVATILMATSVVARGLDIPDVEKVINFDMPTEIEEYVHRIGRTGRVGNRGEAISFFDMEADVKIVKDLRKILSDCGQPVPDWMTDGRNPPQPVQQTAAPNKAAATAKTAAPSKAAENMKGSSSSSAKQQLPIETVVEGSEQAAEKPKRRRRKRRGGASKAEGSADGDEEGLEEDEEEEARTYSRNDREQLRGPAKQDKKEEEQTPHNKRGRRNRKGPPTEVEDLPPKHAASEPEAVGGGGKGSTGARGQEKSNQQTLHQERGGHDDGRQRRPRRGDNIPAEESHRRGQREWAGDAERPFDFNTVHKETQSFDEARRAGRSSGQQAVGGNYLVANSGGGGQRSRQEQPPLYVSAAGRHVGSRGQSGRQHDWDEEVAMEEMSGASRKVHTLPLRPSDVEKYSQPGFTDRIKEFRRREGAGTRSLDHDEPPFDPRGFSRSLSHTGPPSGGSRRTSGPPPPMRGARMGSGGGARHSAPVADIVEILHQQSGSGPPRSTGPRDVVSARGPRTGDFRQSEDRYGRGGPPHAPSPVQDVADLASLLELKARLAQEKADQMSVRQSNRPRARFEERDLSNTSNWPDLVASLK